LQHWSHFCPVQFCFVQWVQSCFFTLLPPANTGPASTTAVMANKKAFLIFLELNKVKKIGNIYSAAVREPFPAAAVRPASQEKSSLIRRLPAGSMIVRYIGSTPNTIFTRTAHFIRKM
jgi:hypothetical protein